MRSRSGSCDAGWVTELGERARRSGYSVDRELTYGVDLILEALGRSAAPTAG